MSASVNKRTFDLSAQSKLIVLRASGHVVDGGPSAMVGVVGGKDLRNREM